MDEKEYFSKLEKLGLLPIDVEFDRIKAKKYEKLSEVFDLGGELFNPPTSVVALAERAKNVDKEEENDAWKICSEFDYSQFYLDNIYSEKLRYLIFL